MKFDTQRLRNLTTGKLHTEMGHIYEDLERITGETGLMTHMLQRVMDAVEPWLRAVVLDDQFWNNKFDTSHVGEVELPTPTTGARNAMLERYKAMPNPLAGKEVIGVIVDQ